MDAITTDDTGRMYMFKGNYFMYASSLKFYPIMNY